MKVYLTRDSVCAGDDGDAPHARTVDVPGSARLDALLISVLALAPLPSIQGGRAAWCVSSGVPFAVIAQEWPTPRLLSFIPPKLAALDVIDTTLRLHFSYFAQQDPQVVFDVLGRLTVRAL